MRNYMWGPPKPCPPSIFVGMEKVLGYGPTSSRSRPPRHHILWVLFPCGYSDSYIPTSVLSLWLWIGQVAWSFPSDGSESELVSTSSVVRMRCCPRAPDVSRSGISWSCESVRLIIYVYLMCMAPCGTVV